MSTDICQSGRKLTVLTVVIPTRNRADLLASALESIAAQTLPADAYEVLVIDNGSTDHTAAVVESFPAGERLRYFYEPEPGLHVGRHRGMLESRGDVLVFADDDIEAFPSWLASIQEAFSDDKVAMVGGNNLPLFMASPPAWLTRLWERRAIRHGRSLPPLSILELTGPSTVFSPYLVWGCNFAIRKSILVAAGGFHPDGMPRELMRFRGDGESHVARYVAKSEYECVFHPGASVYHKVTPERMTFSYFRQRGFNQGVSDSFTALRGQDSGTSSPRPNILRKFAGWGWRLVRNWTLLDGDARRALQELTLGYSEGYAYHQRLYREDAELREWVHKPVYYEEGPE